eukprot:6861177-Pyramimonas_sp.AAC.2
MHSSRTDMKRACIYTCPHQFSVVARQVRKVRAGRTRSLYGIKSHEFQGRIAAQSSPPTAP